MRKNSLSYLPLILLFFPLSLGVNEPLNYVAEAVQKLKQRYLKLTAVQKLKQGYLKLTAVQKKKTSLGKNSSFNLIPF